MQLKDEQSKCRQLALQGHNLFITGQAGTGKTVTLKAIAEELIANKNNSLHITTTTGIATLQFPKFKATTIHHWAGIADGRYTTPEIIEKVNNQESYFEVKNRIKTTTTLIIDELSMLSEKTFNQINELCKYTRNISAPFGGIQIVAGGSFKQLPPIANPRYLDNGNFCFQSINWDAVFPVNHRFKLENVIRTRDLRLKLAIGELEDGSPSDNTDMLLRSLSRPINQPCTHLFATREDVDMFNRDCLNQMPGVSKKYTATDDNVQRHLQGALRVPKILPLKVGAPVILVHNINIHLGLVNGQQGIVHELKDNSVIVKFPNINFEVKQQVFSVYDTLKKKTLCTRLQLPIILGYAITIHKAQGMTIPFLEIDCSTIFCAGQLAVAVGRAVSIDGLRILNYNTAAAKLQHRGSVVEFYQSLNPPSIIEDASHLPSLTCCVKSSSDRVQIPKSPPISNNVFTQQPSIHLPHATTEPSLPIPSPSELFTFDVDNPNNGVQSEMVYLYSNIKATLNFILFWNLVANFVETAIENLQHPSTKDWNAFSSSFHDFLHTAEYLQYKANLFTNIPSQVLSQNSLCYKLATKAKEIRLFRKSEEYISNLETNDSITLDNSTRSVVRYVAGYAVGSLRKSCHSAYAKSTDSFIKRRWTILRELTKPYIVITKQTKYPESFAEITRRTTSTGDGSGLTCVTDEVFDFFIQLYVVCGTLISLKNINVYQSDIFSYALSKVLHDTTLYETWFSLTSAVGKKVLDESDAEHQTITYLGLYQDLVEKFVAIIIKDTKKKLVESKGKQKTVALRKGLKNLQKNNKPTTSQPSTSKTPSTSKAANEIDEEEEEEDFVIYEEDDINIAVEFPCGKCGEETEETECIECSLCSSWFHLPCCDLTGSEIYCTNENMDYYCPDCDVDISSKKRKARKRKFLD